MALELTWLGCDLVSGRVIEELPHLIPAGPLSSVLATYTSCAFGLPLLLDDQAHGAPPRDWRTATQPARTMIVAVLAGQPIWAGAVLSRKLGTGPVATISCVTLEGYLDRRYVGDHAWNQQDEASVIAAGLIADANVEGIGFDIDAPAMGHVGDLHVWDYDDKTVYSALRSLMGRENGPEWAIVLGWTDDPTPAISKTIRVRTRIGMAASIPSAVFDVAAAATFDAEGATSTRYESEEDYTSGSGANHIVATSSGQGESRPQSEPVRDEDALAAGTPRWEHRYSPETSSTDPDTLTAHARRAAALMFGGARTVTVTARADVYPVLGTHWHVGDDVGYDLVGHGHPDGFVGVARAIGWELEPKAGTVSPILLQPGTEVI